VRRYRKAARKYRQMVDRVVRKYRKAEPWRHNGVRKDHGTVWKYRDRMAHSPSLTGIHLAGDRRRGRAPAGCRGPTAAPSPRPTAEACAELHRGAPGPPLHYGRASGWIRYGALVYQTNAHLQPRLAPACSRASPVCPRSPRVAQVDRPPATRARLTAHAPPWVPHPPALAWQDSTVPPAGLFKVAVVQP